MKITVPLTIVSILGLYGISYATSSKYILNEPYSSPYPILPPGTGDTLDYYSLKSIDDIILRLEIGAFWRRSWGYNNYILQAASKYQITNNLIRAIMYTESNGMIARTSSVGAIGLMQIKYPTAISYGYEGSRLDLYEPETNILIGTRILAKQKMRYGGNILDTISAYHWGSVFRWDKEYKGRLSGIKLPIALERGYVVRLNGPYDGTQYGPYFNDIHISKVIKMYDLFNQVIVKIE